MMNNNKILTVSYGTFSCTLEGFDDSFDTMKAIAEYFRDLAADDRYFGAEPPQPDAEMLAKIAEREVSRRVEAHEHEGRIMLKAQESEMPSADQPSPLPVPGQSVETVQQDAPAAQALAGETEEEPEPEVSDVITPEDSAAAFFANSPSVSDAPEENEGGGDISVEAFTNYISAGAAKAPDAGDVTEEEFDEAQLSEGTTTDASTPEYSEQDPAIDPVDETEAMPTEASEPFAAIVQEESLEQAATIENSEASASVLGASEEVGEQTPENAPEPYSAEDDEFVQDEQEPATKSIFAAENFADKLQRIRDVVSQRDEEDATTDYDDLIDDPHTAVPFDRIHVETYDYDAEEDSDTPAAEAARDIESALAFDDTEDSDTTESDEIDALDDIINKIDAATDSQHEDTSSAHDNVFGITGQETNEEDEEDIETEDVSVDGRILKVNRSALDAALKSGELEEYNEAASDNAQMPPEEDVEDAKTAARQSLPEIDETEGEDFSRLMAEADQQMDEPEGKTRRSAFAHLRAAVAARFADRSMDQNVEQEEEKETEAYRSDLAEVVKPRRPVTSEEDAKRTTAARPSPLKLVAEQRIDPDEYDDFDNVSPRRVAAGMTEELILEEDTGFAEYADERGANTLPEVLEAAAAYLCHVEGVEQFSRPQLMSRVKQAECGEFSREDGLRAFGQLLRTGKIEKIKGGRFVASDAIGFKPGHRAAG